MSDGQHIDDGLGIDDRLTVSDILGYPPRTHTLTVLRNRGTPMSLDSLSIYVAGRLSDDPSGPVASTVRATSLQLHHSHLPLLDDAGVISYDSAEQVVTSLHEERLDALLEMGRRLLDSLHDERLDRA